MPGVNALSGSSLGLESTALTAVAATEVLRMPVIFPEDQSEIMYAKEQLGIAAREGRPYIAKINAAFDIPKHEVTFEQVCFWLAMSIKNVVTGVADGAGTTKIYAYPFPTTAYPTIKTATIEGYDNQQEYEVNGCFVSEWKISGKAGEAWMFEGKGFGQQLTKSTKTGSLTPPTLEDVLFNLSKFYIDAVAGTIGTTQQLLTFLGFELAYKSGWKLQDTGDGSLAPGLLKWAPAEKPLTGKITMEHDSYATAQHTAFQAATPKLVRIKNEGSTAGTPGTAYSKKTALIDLPLNWTKFSKPKEQDGNNVVDIEFLSQYDLTAALGPSITVVNERAAL